MLIPVLRPLSLLAALAVLGCDGSIPTPWKTDCRGELAGARRIQAPPLPADPFQPPRIREIPLPPIAGADAIWGALGTDNRGRILAGASGHGRSDARLIAYDPATDRTADLGTPVQALATASVLRADETQNKLHSRFVGGADGCIYFSSYDETGEDQRAEILPRWGGHLWRLRGGRWWEHVLAAPEGLVAVGAGGPAVFALGYWGHVLHAYRTDTEGHAHVRVGSVEGHASRNLVADQNGYAYIPRLQRVGGVLRVTLVAFDADLQERSEQPLPHYVKEGGDPAQDHGIVGLARLSNGDIAFTTHLGRLFVLEQQAASPARLSDRGWFHPDGSAYSPGLFAFAGGSVVAGLARRRGGGFDWVVRDLESGKVAAFPFPVAGYHNLLLYGSETTDSQGRLYVAGWTGATGGGQRPILLQVTVQP
jgi:hypothetical protein